MGPVEQSIYDSVAGRFEPELLELTNESHMHSVPPGSESHFKLVLVTDQFEGLRLVQRHQLIYRAAGRSASWASPCLGTAYLHGC